MATSSIKKNFVVNSRKSALELANQLLEVENAIIPTLNRPRISHRLEADKLMIFLTNRSKENN